MVIDHGHLQFYFCAALLVLMSVGPLFHTFSTLRLLVHYNYVSSLKV